MKKINKKLEITYWTLSILGYILGFLLFLLLRLHIGLIASIAIVLLSEELLMQVLWYFFYIKFLKECNRRTDNMLKTCFIRPYIEEMEDFLPSIRSIIGTKKIIVQLLIANAYRFYGDYEKALALYHALSIQKIPEIQRFQIRIFETSIYLKQENIVCAQQSIQAVLTSPQKERFLHMKNMHFLEQEMKRMEANLAYLKQEMSADDYIQVLKQQHIQFPLEEVLQLHNMMMVFIKEGREEEAASCENELAKHTGDVLILGKEVTSLDGDTNE